MSSPTNPLSKIDPLIANLADIQNQNISSGRTFTSAGITSNIGAAFFYFTNQTGLSANVDSSFFSTYNSSTPFPTNWNDFIAAYNSKYLQGKLGLPAADNASADQNILSSLEAAYQTLTGYSGGDWAGITDSTGTTPPSSDTVNSQFMNALNAFLANYPYPASSGAVTMATFQTNFQQFVTQTAYITTAAASAAGNSNFPSFQAYFYSLFPNASQATFNAALSQFYAQELAKVGNGNPANGWFMPSQAYGDWTTFVTNAYTNSLYQQNYIFTGLPKVSVQTASTAKLVVINKIILLLIQMINTIQGVAAAQSNELNFLSTWQASYTTMSNAVHYFLESSSSSGIIGKADSGSSTAYSTARQNLNDYNSAITQQLQGNRSVISDRAKTVQSNVNQSTDQANQQSSLLDSLFQELNTLVGNIFK